MLSRRWPRPKWIKYVAVQGGSAHPSGWNLTLYLQLKRSFIFTQSITFSTKSLLGPIQSKHDYKITKVQKKGSRLRDLKREDRHTSHSEKNKAWDALPIKIAFQHYPQTAYGLTTHITHTIPNQPLKNYLHPLSSWPVICWKKKVRISPDIPIYSV